MTRAWAIRNFKGDCWLRAKIDPDGAMEVRWSENWTHRTLFEERQVAQKLADSFEDTVVIRVTRWSTSYRQHREVIKRYVLPVYAEVALHLLKTGSLKRSTTALRLEQDLAQTQSSLAVSQLRRAGFPRLAERIDHARRR